jgi:hypothetical protein
MAGCSSGVLHKTKMCYFFAKGKCTKGSFCNYAHSLLDQRTKPDLFRTQMCPELLADGTCKRCDCRFAHRKSELRELAMHNSQRQTTLNCDATGRQTETAAAVLETTSPKVGIAVTEKNTFLRLEPVEKDFLRNRSFTTAPGRELPNGIVVAGPIHQTNNPIGARLTRLDADVSEAEVAPSPLHGPQNRCERIRCGTDPTHGGENLILVEKNTFLELEPKSDPSRMRRFKTVPTRVLGSSTAPTLLENMTLVDSSKPDSESSPPMPASMFALAKPPCGKGGGGSESDTETGPVLEAKTTLSKTDSEYMAFASDSILEVVKPHCSSDSDGFESDTAGPVLVVRNTFLCVDAAETDSMRMRNFKSTPARFADKQK